MFGDPQRVIIAGRKAGVKTVGITTGNYSMQELCDAGADFAFKDLTNTAFIPVRHSFAYSPL